jgi:hypothetical protein
MKKPKGEKAVKRDETKQWVSDEVNSASAKTRFGQSHSRPVAESQVLHADG